MVIDGLSIIKLKSSLTAQVQVFSCWINVFYGIYYEAFPWNLRGSDQTMGMALGIGSEKTKRGKWDRHGVTGKGHALVAWRLIFGEKTTPTRKFSAARIILSKKTGNSRSVFFSAWNTTLINKKPWHWSAIFFSLAAFSITEDDAKDLSFVTDAATNMIGAFKVPGKQKLQRNFCAGHVLSTPI